MLSRIVIRSLIATGLCAAAQLASAQSFQVQCPGLRDPNTGTVQPAYTLAHPNPLAPATIAHITAVQGAQGNPALTYADVYPGAIKCQHIAGSDGYATMADGNQIYLFGFAPLSGQNELLAGRPGTDLAPVFNATNGNPAFNVSGVVDANTNPNDAAVVAPDQIMNTGVLYANSPAPMIAIDEGDELFLTLTNVGQIMRPDLFEQHTVHFHGYPQASSFFDGVPDASVAINIAGSFTYYYTAPDAGTYFWHCHITPPEHLQMGMIGQLFVRPQQNRTPAGALVANSGRCGTGEGILCNAPPSAVTNPGAGAFVNGTATAGYTYAYNDGDGSTRYDVNVPIQEMGFDPNFHYVGMTFNQEQFADMKDKYFMLSGRGYPDTVNPAPISTLGSDGAVRNAQPQSALIVLNKSGCDAMHTPTPTCQTRALIRISNLNITEYHTLATVGVSMKVIAMHARLLRDLAGNNLYYDTNSITIGGGESADAIIDVSDDTLYPKCTAAGTVAAPCQTFFLYTTNLDHLSNDAENFGGEMTEIRIL